MATYTNEYSALPDDLLTIKKFNDVTNAVAAYVNEIKGYQAKGDYAAAANRLKALKDSGIDLSTYIIGAEFINTLEEETRNLEIYCLSHKQSLYYVKNEPTYAYKNDVWIDK